MDDYSGHNAFPMLDNFAFVYGLCAGDVSPELRALWTESYRRVLDRYPFYRVTCENQSAHWLIPLYALHHVGDTTDDYGRLAHDYCRMMCEPDLNSFMQTGYQQEAYGPDCTYQGLTCSLVAQYYAWSRDEVALEGLRRIYEFFNHTVAPEPDGRVYGASNFAHRTQYGWNHPQWGAGWLLMAELLPEAAVWSHQFCPDDEQNRQRASAAIRAAVERPYDTSRYESGLLMGGFGGAIYTGGYSNWTNLTRRVDKTAVLPVLREDSFTRNFNDEFFAIRRPAYYALIYTGRTAPTWVKPRISFEPDQCWPRSGGGLSLFWTPQYGNQVVSMNHNAYMSHIVLAELADGKVSWPDYWSVEHHWDQAASTLNIHSTLFDLPVSIVRTYSFLDQGVHQQLRLSFDEDLSVPGLFEQIPFLKNKAGFEVIVVGTEDRCRAIWTGDEQGNGCLIRFDQPVSLSFGKDQRLQRDSEVQVNGVIHVDLGGNHRAGDEVTVGYLMAGCSRDELERTD